MLENKYINYLFDSKPKAKMTETEVQRIIKDFPIGAKLQLIKKNGDIIEVVLASHTTEAFEAKDYGTLKVPAMPPAITVQGKRWGVYRIEIEELVDIARVG